jgi:hypothetical protein
MRGSAPRATPLHVFREDMHGRVPDHSDDSTSSEYEQPHRRERIR